MSEHQKAECVTALPAGTYRVMDGKLYRVEPGLPPSLDTRDAKIATLRTALTAANERAERAEAASADLGADIARAESALTAARALLREVAYGGRTMADVCGPLRARIEAHLEGR